MKKHSHPKRYKRQVREKPVCRSCGFPADLHVMGFCLPKSKSSRWLAPMTARGV